MIGIRGFLRPSGICLTVDFSHQLWFKPPCLREEILSYFAAQGYAEAVRLPWELTSEGLIVKRSVEGFYAVAISSDPNYPPF